MPRHAFLDLLEACIATGLTTILTSVVDILLEWAETGRIRPRAGTAPPGLFVDCTSGADRKLRSLAEASFDDLMRRFERLPTVLMTLRLLDYAAEDNRRIKTRNLAKRPYAAEWLDLVGDLLHARDDEAASIHHRMEDDGDKLEAALQDDYPQAAAMLADRDVQPNPVKRLAAALTLLQGNRPGQHLNKAVDSSLHVGHPNGLAQKRRTTAGASAAGTGRRSRIVRSLVFTDSGLEYLVHLHLLRPGNKAGVQPLSVLDFLRKVRDRRGFHVDTAPPGMTISNELLQANRAALERRLRDLDLLVGVNDAERMKRLRPRFEPRQP